MNQETQIMTSLNSLSNQQLKDFTQTMLMLIGAETQATISMTQELTSQQWDAVLRTVGTSMDLDNSKMVVVTLPQ